MTRSLRVMGQFVSGMALATALAPAAFAQAGAPPAEGEEQEIIVTGIRASLESAQGIKRNATQIVDSIVAEDIGKLPDINVAEALQRVSGIQIGRDRGEGSSIAIRGLTQVLTTLNGREIFTAGNDRTFNLQDLPAELVSGIDVYKTPSSNLIEGGIGGVIDVRTRRPLDSKELVLSASARARYSDLADKVKPMASLLVSKSWDVGDGGEFGILVAGAYQERAFATDIANIGAPAARTDIIAGQTVAAPNGSNQPAISGNRRRIGLDAMVQYKPNPDLEFYAQFGYQDFKSIQGQFGLNIPTNGRTAIPGTAVLFEGTNDIRSISYQNVNFNTFGVARDTYDENFQYSGGVRYDRDAVHLHIDANYSKSTNTLYYSELGLAAVAPRVDQDVSTSVPTMHILGLDLNNINTFTVGSLTRNENHYEGELKSVKGDLTFDIESPFLTGMSFGLRYADRSTYFEPVRYFVASGRPAAPFADLFIPNPVDSMFGGSSAIDQSFLVADYRKLRGDFDGVRNSLGIATAPAVSPLGVYSINEDTMAGYAMGTFAIEGPLRIDGNAGVRVVKTNLNVVGNRAVFTLQPNGSFVQTGFAPVNVDTSYVSVLPSANMRIRFTDELQLRLAASKVLTRPSFGQLAPTLTLVPGQQTGGAGNPNLNPLRADQLDASLEYYFSRTGSIYAAGFYRKVKGFIRNVTGDIEVIDGIEYRISRPVNSEDGKIKGFEVGGQMFMDFLPGALSGFGVQANYTFVDSNTPTSVAGLFTPLPNLSKHSFNTSLIYEKGPVSARVAYNWRDRFYSGLYSSGAIALNSPVYRKAYGWLDASINVDVTDQITLTLEGQNLTRAKTDTYYTVPTRRGNLEQDDIQVLAGVRFTL